MRPRLAGVLVAGALALSGCVATPPPLPFEEESAVADELPRTISQDARDSVEASTVRYQGSTDAVEVWAAREEVDRGICLVVAPLSDPSGWVVGCGGGNIGTSVSLTGGGDYEFYPQGLPEREPREGWVAVSDYVIARE